MLAQKSRPATTITPLSDQEAIITRTFNAPRQLVFDAWTKPEHMPHWWGPRRLTMTVCEIDLRPGGAYRFVLRDTDGDEYGFSGVYQEVVPPERLIYSWGFEGMPGAEAHITATFEEHDGKTTLTSRERYPSAEALEQHLRNGMEEGMNETFERLDEFLATMM